MPNQTGKRWSVGRAIQRRTLRGQNNPQWRGGKMPLIRLIRGSGQYGFWRKQVYERDNYTRVVYGARNGQGTKVVLEVGHILPLAELVEMQQITSLEEAIACTLVWDVANGRTLCQPCHGKTDKYGRNLRFKKES